MIPYDELVAALHAWRARQGFPVSQQPASAPAADSSRTRAAAPPAPPAPQRAAPPVAPPPARAAAPAAPAHEPMPLAPIDTADENLDHLDDASLLEEGRYDNEGDDFAMSFGGGGGGGQRNGHGAHPASDETLVGEDVPDAHSRTHNSRGDW